VVSEGNDRRKHKWAAYERASHNYPGEYARYCLVCGMEDTCEDPLPPCLGNDRRDPLLQPDGGVAKEKE
jgi:hypothetical protein